MSIMNPFHKSANRLREVVLDVETTGLFTSEGHRLLEVGAVEMLGGRATGREFYALVNPERSIPPETTKIHGITDEAVRDKPPFASIAQALRDFIGDDQVVITCRTTGDYTLDIAFLNMEFKRAGLAPVPDAQWVNVRRWSEEMFGDKSATLDKVLDRYGVSRKERDDNGHGAMLDARLLSDVYPSLLKDYSAFSARRPAAQAKNQPNNPTG